MVRRSPTICARRPSTRPCTTSSDAVTICENSAGTTTIADSDAALITHAPMATNAHHERDEQFFLVSIIGTPCCDRSVRDLEHRLGGSRAGTRRPELPAHVGQRLTRALV